MEEEHGDIEGGVKELEKNSGAIEGVDIEDGIEKCNWRKGKGIAEEGGINT